MSLRSRYVTQKSQKTWQLTAAILGVVCALFLVLIGFFVLSEKKIGQHAEVTVSDEKFTDNLETYYDNMEPVPYSSYVAAGSH